MGMSEPPAGGASGGRMKRCMLKMTEFERAEVRCEISDLNLISPISLSMLAYVIDGVVDREGQRVLPNRSLI